MKRILITGGAGSVGREVATCLAARGHRVRVFDLPGCDFGPFEHVAQVQIVKGDIRDGYSSKVWVSCCTVPETGHAPGMGTAGFHCAA